MNSRKTAGGDGDPRSGALLGPFGRLGELASQLLAWRDLKRIFDYVVMLWRGNWH
jgi:hypothetical protein